MQITDIQSYPVWGGSRNFLFVVVDTDEGISGVGEAGITGRELAVVGAIEHFKPLLIGQDAIRIEHLWQVLSRGGFFPAQRHRQRRRSRRSTSRCGTSRARRWACRSTSCWAGWRATRSSATRTTPATAWTSRRWSSRACRPRQEGWKFVRWGLPNDGRTAGAAAGGAGGHRSSSRRCARRSATRSRSVFDVHTRLDLPDARPALPRGRAVPPVLHRRPAALGEPRVVHRRCGRARSVPLAAGEQFSSKWEFRQLIEEELDRLRAHRPVHRRRHHRGEEDRRLVRDPLHQAGAAQPARPGLRRRPASSSTWPAQLRRAGAAAPHRHGADRRRAGAAGVAGRLPAAADAPGPGHRVRPRGGTQHPFRWPSCRSCAGSTGRLRTGEAACCNCFR